MLSGQIPGELHLVAQPVGISILFLTSLWLHTFCGETIGRYDLFHVVFPTFTRVNRRREIAMKKWMFADGDVRYRLRLPQVAPERKQRSETWHSSLLILQIGKEADMIYLIISSR